jgi:hypothetical protein
MIFMQPMRRLHMHSKGPNLFSFGFGGTIRDFFGGVFSCFQSVPEDVPNSNRLFGMGQSKWLLENKNKKELWVNIHQLINKKHELVTLFVPLPISLCQKW